MKLALAIILFLAGLVFMAMMGGCAVPQSQPPTPVFRSLTSQSVIQPAPYHLSWLPGNCSNFVIVASSDISRPRSKWKTFAVTTNTSVPLYITAQWQFFNLYGTNFETGESGWVVNSTPQ